MRSKGKADRRKSGRREEWGARERKARGEEVNLKTIIEDPKLVAYCGLYCGACNSYRKGRCSACHNNDKATWCKVRRCCIENGYSSCAECKEYEDPDSCKNFNNVISRTVGFFLRSDRRECIYQIKRIGIDGHAHNMASNMRQTIKRTQI